MSTTDQPSEEELRAAYEAEIKKIRVEQILLEQVVSLVNLGMRRTGLAPGTEDERDIGQVRVAIEAVRALLPLIEQTAPAQAGQIRDALSQLQLAFVRLGGAPAGPSGPVPGAADPAWPARRDLEGRGRQALERRARQAPAGPDRQAPEARDRQAPDRARHPDRRLPASRARRSPSPATGDRLSAAAGCGCPASSAD